MSTIDPAAQTTAVVLFAVSTMASPDRPGPASMAKTRALCAILGWSIEDVDDASMGLYNLRVPMTAFRRLEKAGVLDVWVDNSRLIAETP